MFEEYLFKIKEERVFFSDFDDIDNPKKSCMFKENEWLTWEEIRDRLLAIDYFIANVDAVLKRFDRKKVD